MQSNHLGTYRGLRNALRYLWDGVGLVVIVGLILAGLVVMP